MYKDSESYSLIKSIILESKPTRQFLKVRTEYGVLIVTSNNMTLHFLNQIAGNFFLMCDGTQKVKAIIDEINKEYDVKREELENDIIDLIRDLQIKRLIYIDPLEIDYERD